jgi:ApbE superfamily uncharacterized protein (UPF0280 family)
MTGAGPCHRRLADGRLHLQHGPIDMILQAEGPQAAVAQAEARAVRRFDGLLEELVSELPELRRAVRPEHACPLQGPVARVMARAARAHLPAFVTPMAAVAGAGADAVLAAMTEVPGLRRAHVNNGGDIALFLAPGAPPFRLGVVVDPATPASPGRLELGPGTRWRGVATSGAKGRSHSLGIADSVTVIATDAAAADVAATLIANAVDLPGDPAIRRAPASHLAPDSDLGDRPVTVAVGPLAPDRIAAALDRGEAAAHQMLTRGLIGGALLVLQHQARVVGDLPLLASAQQRRHLAHA